MEGEGHSLLEVFLEQFLSYYSISPDLSQEIDTQLSQEQNDYESILLEFYVNIL